MTKLQHIKGKVSAVLVIIAVTLTAIATGCNSDGCLENRSAIPLAGFYSGEGKGISLDSLRITGIGRTDTIALYQEGTSISSAYLPMRSTQSVTSWQFAYKWKYLDEGNLCDTITFDYSSEPYFASDECGVIYRYHITKLTHTTHLIDSIAITDSLITNLDIEQIKIYFRTQSAEETPQE